MKNTVNSRVLLLKKELRLNDVEFCGRASISTSTLNKIKNEEKITQKIIYSIINAFNVNKDWLLDNKGKMFNPEKNTTTLSTSAVEPWKEEAYTNLKNEVSFYQQQIKNLTEILQTIMSNGGGSGGAQLGKLLGNLQNEFLNANELKIAA